MAKDKKEKYIKNFNLKEGDEFKSFIDMLKELKIPTKPAPSTSVRKTILKELSNYCEYEVIKPRGIKILKVFPMSLSGIGNKGGKKYYPNFKVEECDEKSKGIYKIVLNNEIYIGSTIDNFRGRYQDHIGKNNILPTKGMLEQGATFEIIQICNGMSENEIRHIEQQWIEEFRSNPEWVVINSLDHVQIKGEKHRNKSKNKQKYRRIKIKEEDYEKVLKLLKNNEIEIIE